MKQKGIAISGGGAFGAWTLGKLEARNETYTIGSGVSTGALLVPLVLLKEFHKLRDAYTSVTTKDITEISAFRKNGHLSIPRLVYRTLAGKRTFGESQNLRALIDKFLTEEDYHQLGFEKLKAIVSCYSLSYDEIVHFTSDRNLYEDFKDWMWASANAGPFMSILNKPRRYGDFAGVFDNEQWTDGGVSDGHTSAFLIQQGCRDVDLFLHNPKPTRVKNKNIENVRHYIMRFITSQMKEIGLNDLTIALGEARFFDAKINVHWLPRKLSSNSLVFDKVQMSEWYEEGKEMAFDEELIDTYDFSL